MANDFPVVEEGSDFASLMVISAVGLAGIVAGWVGKQVFGDRQLRRDMEEIRAHIGLVKKEIKPKDT
ncbi:MAG: hypothetical protein MRJ65_15415 [Candidatus Brocadiaceae bacterium]|nr:hypothetical protein [Candidatus Brocadiaceae bacterium]